ncbi:MAG: ATP-dependent Clp protease adaptor ClpS [Treponemataceae bacterium]|nr:ATP-dependent Clp protease adaptor ClpS [Treponemataceae bacterium]
MYIIKTMDFEFEQNISGSFAEEDFLEPNDYQVVLYNDDYTTKDFVVLVLQKYFHKNMVEAVEIMENVHKKGSAVVGVYPYDIAATRVQLTLSMARANGFPLRCGLDRL